MSQFAGKTAIISGGAEGIGFSIATALGEQAMNIVLADIDEENLKKARLKLESAGIPVLAVALDVADEAQWNEVAERTIERFGKIHMLVNNAGIGGDTGPIENAQTRGWQWALDVNLLGVVYGTKVMVPWITQQGEGENGIDVSIVGKRVVEALNAGELYIFTHPNYRALVQQRFQAIDAAFERAAESPLLQHVVKQKVDFS